MAQLFDQLPGIRKRRLAWILVHTGLVVFSSTQAAGDASEYAFRFYRLIMGLGNGYGLHLMAQKSVHFVLFFTLGAILYDSLVAPAGQKVLWTLGLCLVVGFASEMFQAFTPSRHPSLADIALNGLSGLLGAVLLSLTARQARLAS